jgi:hypothetical protein
VSARARRADANQKLLTIARPMGAVSYRSHAKRFRGADDTRDQATA